jgi:hypothetical protein
VQSSGKYFEATKVTSNYRTIEILLAAGWTVGRWSPGRNGIFRNCPDRTCGILPYKENPDNSVVKRSVVNHSRSTSAEVKERVELYLYSFCVLMVIIG